MSRKSLTIYLNDPLAGSVAAVELLRHLAEAADTAEARQFFEALHDEVAEDQQTLEALLRRVGGPPSRLRQVGAWLTEKMAEVRLRLASKGEEMLGQVEALEALSLGIQGKSALWAALETLGGQLTELRDVDLGRLQARARDQHARVERRRLLAVRDAFGRPATESA